MRFPHGYRDIVQTYGDPLPFVNDHAGWEARLELFVLPFNLDFGGSPVRRVRCHRLVGPSLLEVLSDLMSQGLGGEVQEFNGIYAFRQKRTNAREFSVHTFGAAIDLNASRNPLGGESSQHPAVIATFKDHGWTWGGDFHGTKDPMHFQACSGF